MRWLIGWGVLAGTVLALAAADARAVDQAAIDRAVDRGVEALRHLQREDGTWPYPQIGATALAGLALLECGVPAGDPAVQKAARAVRAECVTLTHTYSVALSLLFLDRLGDADDVPLIESLGLRLLGGQDREGGWGYHCPAVPASEGKRLTELIARPGQHLAPPQPAQETPGRRDARQLAPEIRQQVALLKRQGPGAGQGFRPADNSNTQFATLALWVARRHGLPVTAALKRTGVRYRLSQNGDGGWGYLSAPGSQGGPAFMRNSTATMTCAGLLGLTVAHGVAAEAAREKTSHGRPPTDPGQDRSLRAGLRLLGTAIGRPAGPGGRVPPAAGRAYYFFWSLERVAVALDLKTIGKKDWYAWGAEILLANQQADGSWQGAYADCGADTCFALLFLKRANLARDLTAYVKGVSDPGGRVLRAGGIGGAGLRDSPPPALRPPLEAEKNDPQSLNGTPPTEETMTGTRPATGEKRAVISPEAEKTTDTPRTDVPGRKEGTATRPRTADHPEAARLGSELVRARGEERAGVLERLRAGKGVIYTEALATAIPHLGEKDRDRARKALAERLQRMTAATLGRYLKDDDPEIRRAAALACAGKNLRAHIPTLIWLLSDRDPETARAAHSALKTLTRQDLGPPANASEAERSKAVADWKRWWASQKQD